MDELGMTPSRFAARLYIGGPTLQSWLLPAGALDAKTMPQSGKAYILEVLEQDRTKRVAESQSQRVLKEAVAKTGRRAHERLPSP